jgi:biopolymer transport protein ExbD
MSCLTEAIMMATGEIEIIMKIGITDAIVMVVMAAIIATVMAIVESLELELPRDQKRHSTASPPA